MTSESAAIDCGASFQADFADGTTLGAGSFLSSSVTGRAAVTPTATIDASALA